MNTIQAKSQAKNDAFRKAVMFAPHPDGKAVMTPGVAGLGSAVCAWIYKQIAEFDDFTEDNNPYGAHDFGSVTVSVSHLMRAPLNSYNGGGAGNRPCIFSICHRSNLS